MYSEDLFSHYELTPEQIERLPRYAAKAYKHFRRAASELLEDRNRLLRTTNATADLGEPEPPIFTFSTRQTPAGAYIPLAGAREVIAWLPSGRVHLRIEKDGRLRLANYDGDKLTLEPNLGGLRVWLEKRGA